MDYFDWFVDDFWREPFEQHKSCVMYNSRAKWWNAPLRWMQPYYVDAVFSVLCIEMILCDLYLHQDPASYAVMQVLYLPPSPTSLFFLLLWRSSFPSLVSSMVCRRVCDLNFNIVVCLPTRLLGCCSPEILVFPPFNGCCCCPPTPNFFFIFASVITLLS